MTAESLLENPAVRARIARFTIEQYHQFGEFSATGRRTELIRGYVFEKMPKSPAYTSIGTRLYNLLFPQLSEGWWMHKEEPLTFADSEPEPDISIMRGQESDFEHAHPRTAALVAEIAVTTLAEDRALVSLYAEAGVEEYWIVIPRSERSRFTAASPMARMLKCSSSPETRPSRAPPCPALRFHLRDFSVEVCRQVAAQRL